MNREIRIRIAADGKVEIDSSVYTDCKEVAAHLTRVIGKAEEFYEKDELDTEERLKIDTGE